MFIWIVYELSARRIRVRKEQFSTMPLTPTPFNEAILLADELGLQSARANAAGLSLTAYLIDMAAGEVRREAVKIALSRNEPVTPVAQ
jgi:hypothetical protein